MNDSYVYIIVALLPLAALMLTVQANPYNALVIRGILGAVAALVYAVLGAADVALTEALVGTMLAITLYAVAVRSSLVMQIGVLKDELQDAKDKSKGEMENDADYTQISQRPFSQLIADLRTIASKYHLRLEVIPYPDPQSLHQALIEKAVHVTCIQRSQQQDQAPPFPESGLPPYHTVTRIRRLYDILQTELSSPTTNLTYVTAPELGEKH
jgi:putative multicomponent Na+:H+ antiporter subunit B